MLKDAATPMRSRLRSDLLIAMRSGQKLEVALIRELLAAIDNAEAPPLGTGQTITTRHDFRSGSVEVEGLSLSQAQVRALLLSEIQKREQAAAEFENLGDLERASAFRTEALVAKRYVQAVDELAGSNCPI